MERPNIDAMIDWPQFYSKYIKGGMKPAGGDKLLGRCPLGTHDDKHASFWMTTSNGMWKCEACGEQGNATAFLARMEHITTGEAYKQLCELAGADAPQPTPKTYTLKEYAFEKHLPVEFLETLGVKDGYKRQWVEIPYMDERGKQLAVRKRMPKGSNPRFLWSKGAKPTFYGRWRMDAIREAGHVILVEGESDAQTLWHLGRPALGYPGASNFNAEYAKLVLDIPIVYLHLEPDEAARKSKRRIAQAFIDAGYRGIVKLWACVAHNGIKDPSQLYCTEGDAANGIIGELMADAQILNLEQTALADVEGLEDAPAKLRVPEGYELDGGGIYEVDPKTGMADTAFCWTPLIITRQLRDIANDERKIEYAFKDHTGWIHGIVPRELLATSRTITALSAKGADVTSENAASMVRWISALERANGDLIEHQKCVTQYGWIDDTHFSPCALGAEYIFDRSAWNKYGNVGRTSGTLPEWVEVMRPHRSSSVFRFILAASFAAPLLKIVRERTFIVYNWGDSKGGKTAALAAALSAWGDPNEIMASFNTTAVGAERVAGLMNDLPLGLNERQLAGAKQDFLDKLIYQLAEGNSKGRGTREGGLQFQSSWRNIVISNGEEPLTGDASQTGTVTRALEIFGKPFSDEEAASRMYTATSQQFGHAGIEYIAKLMAFDKPRLREMRDKLIEDLKAKLKPRQRNHATYMATVCLADFLISGWFFGATPSQAYDEAIKMAVEVFGAMRTGEEDLDVNRRAYDYLLDWVAANRAQFTDSYKGTTRYGYLESGDEDHVMVFPSILDGALKDAGYSARKTRQWMSVNGKVDTTMCAGKKRDTAQLRVGSQRMWMVRLLVNGDAATEQSGFEEVHDIDLPF